MEFKIAADGSMTMTTADPIEAAAFIKAMQGVPEIPTGSKPVVPPKPDAVKFDPKTAMKSALDRMNGNASGKILRIIADLPDDCTDKSVREKLGEDIKIGPALAHMSRMATQAGLTRESILLTTKTVFGRGVIQYKYKLTPEAKEAIGQIEGFGQAK